MTAAAVLPYLCDLHLEGVGVRGRRSGGLRIGYELGELGLEIGFVLPDRRQGRGVAAGLRAIGEERAYLFRLREGREDLLGGVEVEGLLALQHVGGNLALVAVRLHDGLAGRDRIA